MTLINFKGDKFAATVVAGATECFFVNAGKCVLEEGLSGSRACDFATGCFGYCARTQEYNVG